MKNVFVLLIVLATWSPAPFAQSPSEEEMLITASALTKLAAAAESAVRYKEPPNHLSEREFLEFATRHDPSLLEPVTTYQLRASRKDGRAAVLVCSADGLVRLLEDAGCTAVLDGHHWRGPAAPCDFALDLRETCP